MNENEIGATVIDCAAKVHGRFDPNLLEQCLFRKVGYLLSSGEALMKDGISRSITGKLK